ILRHEGKENGILGFAVKKQTPAENTFPDGSSLFGHTLAGFVIHSCDNFQACELEFTKGKLGCQAHRRRCYSVPGCAGSHPVTEVAKIVDMVDKVDPDTPEKEAIGPGVDNETVMLAAIPLLLACGQEFGAVMNVVLRMAPRQPFVQFFHRLLNCLQ